MRYNIKTYRFYANVMLSWYNSYKAGKCTMKTLQYVFDTKMNLFANPYKQLNFEKEIIRLIGRKNYTILKGNYLTQCLMPVTIATH